MSQLQEIAKAHGVSTRTVLRAAAFAKSVDAIGDVAPELKTAILAGEVKASDKELNALANAPADTIKAVARSVIAGDSMAVKKAVSVQPADRDHKEAKRAFGVLVRYFDKVDRAEEFRPCLEPLAKHFRGNE